MGGTFNAGQAVIKGVELDGQYRIGGLTLSTSGAYNDARLSRDLCNLGADRNPLPDMFAWHNDGGSEGHEAA